MPAEPAAPTDAATRHPVRLVIPVAWGEMDAFQHVNNTVYLRWLESVRIAYFERLDLLARMRKDGVAPILARTEIDYRRPVTFPDTVTVSAGATRIGTSSFTIGYRIRTGTGRLASIGQTAHVCIDRATFRACAIPDELLALLIG